VVKLWSLRPPVLRWWWLVWLVWTVQLAAAVLRWLFAHLTVLAGLLIVAGTWYVVAAELWLVLALATGCVLLAGGGWLELHRVHSWAQLRQELASLRRLRWYRQRWDEAVDGAGLVRAGVPPVLEAHRYGGTVTGQERDLDVLTVRLAPGQLPGDWRQVASRLASTWAATGLRAHPVPGRSDLVELYVRHRRLDPRLSDAQRAAAGAPDTVEQPATAPPPPGAFPRTPRRSA
jgi:hypothetical protein